MTSFLKWRHTECWSSDIQLTIWHELISTLRCQFSTEGSSIPRCPGAKSLNSSLQNLSFGSESSGNRTGFDSHYPDSAGSLFGNIPLQWTAIDDNDFLYFIRVIILISWHCPFKEITCILVSFLSVCPCYSLKAKGHKFWSHKLLGNGNRNPLPFSPHSPFPSPHTLIKKNLRYKYNCHNL